MLCVVQLGVNTKQSKDGLGSSVPFGELSDEALAEGFTLIKSIARLNKTFDVKPCCRLPVFVLSLISIFFEGK